MSHTVFFILLVSTLQAEAYFGNAPSKQSQDASYFNLNQHSNPQNSRSRYIETAQDINSAIVEYDYISTKKEKSIQKSKSLNGSSKNIEINRQSYEPQNNALNIYKPKAKKEQMRVTQEASGVVKKRAEFYSVPQDKVHNIYKPKAKKEQMRVTQEASGVVKKRAELYSEPQYALRPELEAESKDIKEHKEEEVENINSALALQSERLKHEEEITKRDEVIAEKKRKIEELMHKQSMGEEELSGIRLFGRLVKGERSYSYVDGKSNIVKDNMTNLLWQIVDNGEGRDWESAQEYCRTLLLDGVRGWRLPTIKELYYLADRTKHNPAIDTKYFKAKSTNYWSISEDAFRQERALDVNFALGDDGWSGKSSLNLVRCVK